MNLEKYKQIEVKIERTSERAEIIKQFLQRLNEGRLTTPYKPLTPQGLAVKLSHLNISDLYFFLKKCEMASNFSKCFWGSLKKK